MERNERSTAGAGRRYIYQRATWHEDTPVGFGAAAVFEDEAEFRSALARELDGFLSAPAPDDPEHVYRTLTVRVDDQGQAYEGGRR